MNLSINISESPKLGAVPTDGRDALVSPGPLSTSRARNRRAFSFATPETAAAFAQQVSPLQAHGLLSQRRSSLPGSLNELDLSNRLPPPIPEMEESPVGRPTEVCFDEGTSLFMQLAQQDERFSSLSQAELKMLANITFFVHVEEGNIFIREDDLASFFVLVLDGSVSTYCKAKPSPVVIGVGSLLGAEAFFFHENRSISAKANSDQNVLAVVMYENLRGLAMNPDSSEVYGSQTSNRCNLICVYS
jgi:hypothetical protein